MKTFITILVVILVLGGGWYFYQKTNSPVGTNTTIDNTTNTTNTTSTTTHTTSTPITNPDIIVDSPVEGSSITSPLTVTGRARGTWFFEASAPFEVRDASGHVLGHGPIQAQGDWMTTNFVPFKGTITFTKASTTAGTVVFMNDNPSGQASTSKSFSVQVYFK